LPVTPLVLRIARSNLAEHLNAYVGKHRQLVATAVENWWDKYAETLRSLDAKRDMAQRQFNAFLAELGYE
jgi:type I restriction enzyme M protein